MNLDGKPVCEIICRFGSCKNSSVKLSLIKQQNEFAPPKFNTFNYERHVKSHEERKRKHDESFSFHTPAKKIIHSTPFVPYSNTSTVLGPLGMTPKTVAVHQLKKELDSANDLIKELQTSGAQILSAKQQVNSDEMTPKTLRISELKHDLVVMKEENFMLRHKWMNERSHIQTFCRIKPQLSGDVFSWERSGDGTSIKLRMLFVIWQPVSKFK